MTLREQRLLDLEERAEKRRRRRKVNWLIAVGFGRIERADWWLMLTREAEQLATRLWMARVESGTKRWAADDADQCLRAVQ